MRSAPPGRSGQGVGASGPYGPGDGEGAGPKVHALSGGKSAFSATSSSGRSVTCVEHSSTRRARDAAAVRRQPGGDRVAASRQDERSGAVAAAVGRRVRSARRAAGDHALVDDRAVAGRHPVEGEHVARAAVDPVDGGHLPQPRRLVVRGQLQRMAVDDLPGGVVDEPHGLGPRLRQIRPGQPARATAPATRRCRRRGSSAGRRWRCRRPETPPRSAGRRRARWRPRPARASSWA